MERRSGGAQEGEDERGRKQRRKVSSSVDIITRNGTKRRGRGAQE